MRFQLRPYQENAIENVRRHLRAGKRRVVLVAPTGSGKTVVASSMIESAVAKQSKILFLAHRRELIDQCSNKLDHLDVDHGIVMADHWRYRPHLPVQVASVQTATRRLDSGRFTFSPSLIFIDEAHHARARSYQAILDAFPQAAVVGLTATPCRADGRGLGELFEEMVIAASVRELTAQGALVPARGFTYDVPDLSGVKSTAGDYNEVQLEQAMDKIILAGDIVKEWQAHADGERTVVFAVNVKHSKIIVEQFREAGIAAEHVDDQTPTDERAAILQRLAGGITQVVSNVGILTEGWDLPSCTTCILARPTKSLALALQMMGRVLRPAPGKFFARIHDHARVILDHGLPEDDREWSLDLDKPPGAAPHKECPECFCINPASARECIECGAVFEIEQGQAKEIEVREGVRVDLDALRAERERRGIGRELTDAQLVRVARATREDKAAEYLRLQLVQQRKNLKPGFVARAFQDTFGHWPKFKPEELEGVAPAARPFLPLPPRPANDSPRGDDAGGAA